MTSAQTTPAPTEALRRWMLVCIGAVFLTVSVGGITRLTESGLSITEWRPVSGVLPPMNKAQWQQALEMFQQIPQAQTTHAGITMGEFKFIYWWEWFHRIVARGVGLVFAIPFLWFWAKGMLTRRLWWRLVWLPFLTLCQGFLGWYMVQSGLAERTEVSAVRLAMHLSLALAILAVALWTHEDLRERPPEQTPTRGWRRLSVSAAALIIATIVAGAFVAGLRAGESYNTFPLMAGELFPTGYASVEGFFANATQNPIAAQFHHRWLGVATALFIFGLALRGARQLAGESLAMLNSLRNGVLLQTALGIATLLLAVPVWLGAIHQLVGVLVVSAAIRWTHRLRHPGAGPRAA